MSGLRNYYCRQALFAIGHAVCLLLALSPFDIWPLGFAAPALMFLASDGQRGARPLQILAASLMFSLATTAITFGWIAGTIWRYTGQNLFLASLLAMVYAIVFQLKFPLVFFALRSLRLTLRQGAAPLVATASVVAIADALAPELFPWSWGNGIAGEPHLRQIAAIGSVYLVGFFAVLVAAVLLAPLLRRRSDSQSAFNLGPALLIAALILCALLFRYWPDTAPSSPPLRVAIAQTSIGPAPAAKSSDENFAREAINRLFAQSVDALQLHAPLDLILWPEASMPFHSASPSVANRNIYSVTFDGALEYLRRRAQVAVIYHDMHKESNALRSRFAARGADVPEAQYFKKRLVPWGEYLPFGARRWFPEAGNFTPGSLRPQALELPLVAQREHLTYTQIQGELSLVQQPAVLRQNFDLGKTARVLQVQPLLCYEALYPSDAQTQTADVIINLASDAWFGDGFEGAQHASATVLRAVENGRPMLRAAMSGISFAVDNRGENLVARTGQGRPETLFAEIPLTTRRTPFSVLGMISFYALMFAASWPWLLSRLTASRIRENK